MESINDNGCARTLAILASIAAIISVIVAILAWLMPFNPVGTSPIVSRPDEQTSSDSPIATQGTSPNNQATNFVVIADQSWQNTGVRVDGGDVISIRYLSGLWDWTSEYPDFDAYGDPDSQNTCNHISELVSIGATPGNCPVPGEQVGALVGKIGNETPFYVGGSYSFSIPNNVTSGTILYLMTNDVFGGLGDNDGQIEVEINVSSE